MITGVNSSIFASGDRTSDRKATQRDGRDRFGQSRKPGLEEQCALLRLDRRPNGDLSGPDRSA